MKWNELKRIAIAHGFQFYKGLKGHDLYINKETKNTSVPLKRDDY